MFILSGWRKSSEIFQLFSTIHREHCTSTGWPCIQYCMLTPYILFCTHRPFYARYLNVPYICTHAQYQLSPINGNWYCKDYNAMVRLDNQFFSMVPFRRTVPASRQMQMEPYERCKVLGTWIHQLRKTETSHYTVCMTWLALPFVQHTTQSCIHDMYVCKCKYTVG